MPPNNPLASLFNLFSGSGGSPSSAPRGGPGFGGPPGRTGGFPGLGGMPRGFSGYGSGAAPGSGSSGGFLSGFGGGASRGGFGIGDLVKNLGKMDVTKVMSGINNFRNMMASAQKVAQTLNQLGITVGNIQKIMKQVDVNGLLNLLQGPESGTGESNPSEGEVLTKENEPTPKTRNRPKRRKKKGTPASVKGTSSRSSKKTNSRTKRPTKVKTGDWSKSKSNS